MSSVQTPKSFGGSSSPEFAAILASLEDAKIARTLKKSINAVAAVDLHVHHVPHPLDDFAPPWDA